MAHVQTKPLVNSDPLADTKAAAEYLNVSPGTLRNWLCAGNAPEHLKINTRVYYRQSALDAFIEQAAQATRAELQNKNKAAG